MSSPMAESMGYGDDVLTPSETLDEDTMGTDPLERGMDPAEEWSAANRYGTTASEQATDRPLSERLREERPDVTGKPVPRRPVAATPIEELDDSIDDELVPGEPVEDGQVLVGEPDQPPTDEAAYTRQE